MSRRLIVREGEVGHAVFNADGLRLSGLARVAGGVVGAVDRHAVAAGRERQLEREGLVGLADGALDCLFDGQLADIAGCW